MAGMSASAGSWGPAAMSLLGSGVKAYGQAAEGEAAVIAARRRAQAAAFQAEQLDMQANDVIAASQIRRQLVARDVKLVQSALIARAAASGAGASDPTVVNLVARNAAEGAFREGVALYEGERQARTLRLRALSEGFDAQNVTADAAATKAMSRLAAVSTLTSGVASSMGSIQKYWKAPESAANLPTATGDD